MADKITKAESDGVKIKYTTESGRELNFDLSTQEGLNQYRAFVGAMGIVGVQYAEELVGFTLPQGV